MAFVNIHNDYKHLALQQLNDMLQVQFNDTDLNFLKDLVCIGLS